MESTGGWKKGRTIRRQVIDFREQREDTYCKSGVGKLIQLAVKPGVQGRDGCRAPFDYKRMREEGTGIQGGWRKGNGKT